MDSSESSIDQIGFEHVTDGVIIFSFCILKSIKGTFQMDYDQRVIIRFRWNEGIDAHEMIHRLQTQFSKHAYALRMVQFWIAERQLGRQDLHDEIRTWRPPLDDFDAKILTVAQIVFRISLFYIETLRIVHTTMLLHLHDSAGFRPFHLHCVPRPLMHDLGEKWMEFAQAMLPVLPVAERNDWHYLVTGDESWCFLNI
jgi:hypothetical protein